MGRNLAASVAALGLCFIAMVGLALARGVWLDEIWTLWLVPHDVPVTQLYHDRWSFEPHPPVFYAWVWGLTELLPTDVPLLRLGNVAGLVSFGLAAWIARRRGASRAMLLTYALIVFGSPLIVVYFGELRSYFLQISVLAGLILLLQRVHFAASDFVGRRDAGLIVAILLWLLVGAWLHYLNAAFCFTVAGTEALHQMWRRRWAFAGLLSAIVAIGCVSLMPPLLHYLSLGPVSSPMNVSPAKGYLVTGAVIGLAAVANFAALLLALIEARSTRATGSAGAIGYTVTILAAVLIVALAFTTLNASKGFIVPRYLLGFVPLVAAPIALLAGRRFGDRWFLAVPLNAAFLALAAFVAQAGNKRWEQNIPVIKAARAACPTTRVIGLDPFTLAYDQSVVPKASGSAGMTMKAIIEGGYSYLSAHNGFPVEFVRTGPAKVPRDCPIIVWVESNYFRDGFSVDDVLGRAGVSTDPKDIGSKRLLVSGDHALAFAYPAK